MATCSEIGPVSTANASAYNPTRIHDVRLMLGTKKCLVANFNGAIDKARTIASVKWRCFFGYVAVMANARIQDDARSSAVGLTANWLGDDVVRCEATLDNGEIAVQVFHVDVSGSPIFGSAQSGSGPTELDA